MTSEPKYVFRINSLSFSCGAEIAPRRINIFIGPNNSGKSKVLKEIRYEILGHWNPHGLSNLSSVVLSKLQLNLPNSIQEFESSYEPLEKLVSKTINGWRVRAYCNTGLQVDPNGNINYYNNQPTFHASNVGELRNSLDNSLKESNDLFLQIVGPEFISYSGTDDRLLLSIGEPARGLEDDSYNTLSSALDVDPYLYSISDRLKELFNKDVILDVTSNRQIIVPRVSKDFSGYRDSITGTKAPDNSILFDSTPLSDEGDGLRSFVAVLISLLGNKKPVYLLDEPESFLHPPFAFEMGKGIASLALKAHRNECQLFISSHSSYLIRGILSEMRKSNSTEELQIIRLAREDDTTHVYQVDANELNRIVSTTGFTPAYVDALFSDNPVLTEAPRDAELFTQIITKLKPVKDVLFIPVNGKQNFSRKLPFYSNAGIRPRLVADFDLLKNTEMFARIIKDFDIPANLADRVIKAAEKLHNAVSEEANRLYPPLEDSDKRTPEAKNHIDRLYKQPTDDSINQYGDNLFHQLDELITNLIPFGILIIRTGTLETIFPNMPPTKNVEHSNDWYYSAIDYIVETETNALMSIQFIKDLLALLEGQAV